MQSTTILTYGFAIFAMFFGSGNLVFPLEIGVVSGSNWFIGFFGLLLTGILLPFLGLFVIKLHKGDYSQFFGGAGTVTKIVLPFFTLSLLGSFGVVPRCIAVAHGGIGYLFPDISLVFFSALFTVVTFCFCLKDSVMITVLGKWMTPVLLCALFSLLLVGIMHAPTTSLTTSAKSVFHHGFITGYQTMDLFAAFFFSSLIFNQIREMAPKSLSERDVLKFAIKPSIIGCCMLAVVYFGLVFLGAHYAPILVGIEPELMLPTIAMSLMGSAATGIIAVAMVLSCLTTAVALSNIYARYLTTSLRLSERRFPHVLVVTTTISFAISLLDFRGIAAFLAPALENSYPGLIALTVVSIATPHRRLLKIASFWLITVGVLIFNI